MPLYAQETYGELEPFVKREWLLTNSLGGFAGGTVAAVNTRRYHGLLVAATLPPVGRVVALSRFGMTLHLDDERHDFSGAYYRNRLTGEGPHLLRRFKLDDDVAQWEYDIAGTKIFVDFQICWHRNACGVRWRVIPGNHHRSRNLSLRLAPFTPMRDFHALRSTAEGNVATAARDNGCEVVYRDLHLHLRGQGGRFEHAPDWWYAQTYPMETARGMDDREDQFTPGTFVLDNLQERDESEITVWAAVGEPGQLAELSWEHERERRQKEATPRPMPSVHQQRLVRAAQDFVVKRRQVAGGLGTTVIAGYPWFSDWGRDTMISLPGLFLSTGRLHEAGQVLSVFAGYVDEGMIPNRFDDYTNEPLYNTVDASLWFIHAVHLYLRKSKDKDTYHSLLRPACEEIVNGYTRGTRFNIFVDPADGLVSAGDETTQLTWMDAKYGETVFTPRHGKAVEINALWYNALRLLGEHSKADNVRENFLKKFWAGEGHGLYDVITDGIADKALRPNQIFAVSLAHSPLNLEQQHVVVDAVRRELLTPYGLRTLARFDPKYQPRYTGPMYDRDQAYHNGTVWPWLIGPFLEAHLKIHDRSPASVERARVWLRPLLEHLEREGCLGSISEVFDAEYPYRPGGCPAQAWSVAEVLRLAIELDM